jgi:tripartite-type tricarboxylate transporter receptor subunit TctC
MAPIRWAACSTPALRRLSAFVLVAGVLLTAAFPIRAQSLAEFYAGKQITFIVAGTPAGGGYDIRARLIGKHIGKHIPGNPRNIITQVMPGAIASVNNIYNVSAKDGTVIALPQRTIFTAQYLATEGIKFDLTKFNWIGNVESDVGIIVGGADTIKMSTDDLFTKEIITGSSTAFTMPAVLNALIGTKFKLINGYGGADDRYLAMERGEVMSAGEISWSNLKAAHGNDLRDKKIKPLIQNGRKKAADLPDAPLSRDFAKGDNLLLLDQFLTQRDIGYPLLMPPGVPADRVEAIRAAFMALGTDEEFKVDAKKAKVDFSLMSGAEVQQIVTDLAAMPEPLIQRLRELNGPSGG